MNYTSTVLVSALALSGCAISNSDSGTLTEAVLLDPYAGQTFVTLPDDLKKPEGITVDPATGAIFIDTFDVPNPKNPKPLNAVLRYSADGTLEARTDFFGITPLLGLEYNRFDKHVYIAVPGDVSGIGSKIARIPANFSDGAEARFISNVPMIGAPKGHVIPNLDGSNDTIDFNMKVRVPNDFELTENGDLYLSDSNQGAIFRIRNVAACAPCDVELVIQSGWLAAAGFPSFGANGIVFNKDQSALFIAVTGDDRVMKYDMATGVISLFAEGINGPDGMKFDDRGNLWVTANQGDHLVALNKSGRVIARVGAYQGIEADGSVRGLLLPGSLVIHDGKIFVTNLSAVANQIPGDEPEEAVTRYTVSKINLPEL